MDFFYIFNIKIKAKNKKNGKEREFYYFIVTLKLRMYFLIDSM